MFGSQTRYSSTAIALHWIVAVLVFVLAGMAFYMVDIPKGDPNRSFFFNLHKSIGLTTGIIVLIRLWWRLKNPPPPLPGSMPGWQVQVSRVSHALLYLCLILMPLSGFSASQFTKYGVTYFGLFKIPPLGFEDKVIYDLLNGIHETTATLLIALVILHVAAALKHALIDRDRVFQRMLPGR